MPEESFADGRAPDAPQRDAGDPVQARTITALMRAKADQQVADLAVVLASAEGRRFVWRVLEHCTPYGSSYSESHALASRLEGRREVGLDLIAWLSAVDPLTYPRLMAEGRRDRATDEAILAARLAEAREREQK